MALLGQLPHQCLILTQQTPNKIFAIVPTGSSIPWSLKGTPYHFIQVKNEHFFGIEKVWIGEARVDITDPERTLLDGLIKPQFCGDFGEVLHAFQMRGDDLDIKRIIDYALKLDDAAAKRLGWVLEQVGIDQALLKPLKSLPVKGYRKLNPSGPST